jgi:ABC-type hemin transport system substrate-binding protein
VILDARPAGRRVVSLVPSATETLLALGANVVGCTRFCEQPHIPAVGGTKNPDLDAVVALTPDVVVIDVEENRREDAEALMALGVALEVTAVVTVDDALAVVARLAAAAGVPIPRAPAPPPARELGSQALVPIWRRPWMVIRPETYGGSLLGRLGVGVIAPGGATTRYPALDLATAGVLRPDLVLVPSEPYAFTDDHLGELACAFPAATVRRVDGQDLFWWGIRTPGALARLDEVLAAPV